nr:hypothetical protein [Clostridia bacterium]
MTLFDLVAAVTLDSTAFYQQIADVTDSGKMLADSLRGNAESASSSFSDAFSTTVGQITADVVRELAQTLVDFTKDSINAASDLEQTNQKIEAVFGDMSSSVIVWANTTKDKFGVGALAAKTYAAQLAGLLSADSYGFASDQIYAMSTGLVELAGDLASFNNMDVDTIWQKLLSGLRGETEAIEDLGIDMRVSALAAFYGMSEKVFSQASSAEQMMMRYNYILANTSIAQGDFARNSDSYANQMAIFEQNIADLQATLGEGLLPVLTDLLQFANSLFGGATSADEVMGGLQDTFVSTYVDIDTTARSALALVEALEKLQHQGVDSEEEQSAWNALVAELTRTLPELGEVIDTTTGQITGGTDALKDYIAQWQETQREIAYQNVLKEAQQEVASQAETVADLEIRLAMAQVKTGGMTISDILADARAYLEEAYGFSGSDKNIYTQLQYRAKKDAQAAYWLESYDTIVAATAEINALESELALERANLALLEQKYIQMEEQVRRLTEATLGVGEDNAGGGGSMTPEGMLQMMNGMMASFAYAVAEAVAGAVSQIGFNIELDGEAIANSVSANMSRRTKSKINTALIGR